MNSFDQSLPMMLNRALDAVMPAYRELFAQYDLTEQQWRVLRTVWTSQKVTSVDLSQRTLLTPSSLVGIVDRLEAKDLVTRIRSVEDRRVSYVVATSKGRALQEEVTPKAEAIHEHLKAGLDDGEWQALEAALKKIEGRSEQKNTSVQAAVHR